LDPEGRFLEDVLADAGARANARPDVRLVHVPAQVEALGDVRLRSGGGGVAWAVLP
jgi:hypothetical protein